MKTINRKVVTGAVAALSLVCAGVTLAAADNSNTTNAKPAPPATQGAASDNGTKSSGVLTHSTRDKCDGVEGNQGELYRKCRIYSPTPKPQSAN